MGVSFQELILLLMIGLIVLGPERLPRVANQLGSWLGQARRMTRVMKRQLEEELNLDRQFDMLPPARTRHATPGVYKPPADTQSATELGDAPSAPGPADVGEQRPAESAEAEKDDTWSPAHGADDPGTGVGDDPVVDEAAAAASDDAAAADGPARDDGGNQKSA